MLITGILLAAGNSSRFGRNKLLYPLSDGTPIIIAAAQTLKSAVDHTLIVTRPESKELTNLLHQRGFQTINCPQAQTGMGASLAGGIKASLNAHAWIIALADMPFVQPLTLNKLVTHLRQGAAIVVPQYQGQRGHPVGFNQTFVTQLTQLSGHFGARTLLQQHYSQITLIPTNDAGIHRDIDVPSDLKWPPNTHNSKTKS